MPHVVILYAGDISLSMDMNGFCRAMADALLDVKDDDGNNVFPMGGTRVLAFPAAYSAISDGGLAGTAAGGSGNYSFIYINLRMGKGRSTEVHHATGAALLRVAKQFTASFESSHHFGLTIQIDQSDSQVYDAKLSTLHPLFS